MKTVHAQMWWIIGALACAGVAGVAGVIIYSAQLTNREMQGDTSTPEEVLTVEEKSEVLDTLNFDGSAMATTSEAEAKGQEALGTVVETSAASEQSEEEKLNVLKALQQ